MDNELAGMYAGQALDRSYAAPRQPKTAEPDMPDLLNIAQRLAIFNEEAANVCRSLSEFLGRCGRGLQGEGAVSASKPHEVGHIGVINQQLEELSDRLTYLSNAASRISQIG